MMIDIKDDWDEAWIGDHDKTEKKGHGRPKLGREKHGVRYLGPGLGQQLVSRVRT